MTGVPQAAWQVTLDGRDLTDTIRPLLLSLTIEESRADTADQLDIRITDEDGKVQIPGVGAELSVRLGWKRGEGLPNGLVDKGRFKVDEVGFAGPPDVITIRARSADFTDSFRVRRERSFVGKSVDEVIGAIAGDNNLTAKVDPALGGQIIDAIGSGPKSDAALLSALGRRFDAVSTVKAGNLIFAPIGSGKTATGRALPTVALARTDTVNIAYERARRDQYDGVSASWHDKGSATRHTVKVGHKGSGRAKHLRKLYASEADARQAAQAENGRIARLGATLRLTLAYGRPDIYPEQPASLSGFKSEIDQGEWLVSKATHKMDGDGGYTTELELEGFA